MVQPENPTKDSDSDHQIQMMNFGLGCHGPSRHCLRPVTVPVTAAAVTATACVPPLPMAARLAWLPFVTLPMALARRRRAPGRTQERRYSPIPGPKLRVTVWVLGIGFKTNFKFRVWCHCSGFRV